MKKIKRAKPLDKLTNGLSDWLAELEEFKINQIDQEMFITKMWQIVGDFEEELKNEERGYTLQIKRIK